jgi:hypothetical protein
VTYFQTKEKYKFLVSKLIFKIILKMKVSLFFLVLFVFSFVNCWAIFEDSQNDGLHRIPVHRIKRFQPNLENARNQTVFNLRKYDFYNRKHGPKPIYIKQNNFINLVYVGEISIGTPGQRFLV